jgi:hypothetical protein
MSSATKIATALLLVFLIVAASAASIGNEEDEMNTYEFKVFVFRRIRESLR